MTLVRIAIAPVFAATMAIQTALVAKCEGRNKRAREDVAKGYYEVSVCGVCLPFVYGLVDVIDHRLGDRERSEYPFYGSGQRVPETV